MGREKKSPDDRRNPDANNAVATKLPSNRLVPVATRPIGHNELIAHYLKRRLGEDCLRSIANQTSDRKKERKVISSHLQQLKKYFMYEENIDGKIMETLYKRSAQLMTISLVALGQDVEGDSQYHCKKKERRT